MPKAKWGRCLKTVIRSRSITYLLFGKLEPLSAVEVNN